jgi:hypothetical protein
MNVSASTSARGSERHAEHTASLKFCPHAAQILVTGRRWPRAETTSPAIVLVIIGQTELSFCQAADCRRRAPILGAFSTASRSVAERELPPVDAAAERAARLLATAP